MLPTDILVQQECIPQAVLGGDVLCQAKSGMGKTAVFVISTLQQINPAESSGNPSVLVMCHTRELAFQIHREYERFSKFFDPKVKAAVCFGGLPVSDNISKLKSEKPVHFLKMAATEFSSKLSWVPPAVSNFLCKVATSS